MRLLAAFVCVGVMMNTAHAQKYPTKPIRLISPFAPGGGTDILSRTIGPQLSAVIGQPVVVDNKPGSSGNLGADLVAKAVPDGYTLLLGYAGTLSINPSLCTM